MNINRIHAWVLLLVVSSCYAPQWIPKSLKQPHLLLKDSQRQYYATAKSANRWRLNQKVGYNQNEINLLKLKNLEKITCQFPEQLRLLSGENRLVVNCTPEHESFDLVIERDTLLPWLKSIDSEPHCQAGSRRNFEDFMLINNQWGTWKLKSGELKLCMFSSHENQQRIYAWEWDSPSDARGVIGYPEVKLLNSANETSGSDANANRPNLPLVIKDLKKLIVDYDSEIYVDKGKFNMAFDLWITEKLPTGGQEIRYEFMIWENRQDFNSFGKKRGIMHTPFGDYMLQTGLMDKTDEVGKIWNYIALVRTENRTSGKVDIKYLIDELVKMGELPNDLNINSVEFGTEIGNSKGYFLLKNIELTML